VFFDKDGNGKLDKGEKVVPYAVVTILMPDGTQVTVTANAKGVYTLPTDLPDGNYTVLVKVPGDDAAPRVGNVSVLGTDVALDIPLVDGVLALTGSAATLQAEWAAALMGLGFALMALSRRRKDQKPARQR
jgi:SdrD B-like domain